MFEVVVLGPVVQSTISANPGLSFNQLFCFMHFFSTISSKLLTDKSFVIPESICGKTWAASPANCVNFDLKL